MSLREIVERTIDLFLAADLQCVSCQRYCKLVKWQLCADCLAHLTAIDFTLPAEQYQLKRLVVCYYYDNFAQKLVYAHKEGRARYYAKLFAAMLAEKLTEVALSVDAVSWVPTTRAKIARRGADHAGDIAAELAKLLNVPRLQLLTVKPQQSDQKKLSKQARIANRQGAFSCNRQIEAGLRVLLIDDVITTGATISSAARAILLANRDCQLFGAAVFYTANKGK